MTDLHIVSCNVRNSGAPDGPFAWPMRRDALLSHLRAIAPDLLGTQEVMADQYDELCAALPAFHAIGVGREDGARGGEFAAIFARQDRFDVERDGTFWLSETPDVVGSVGWDARLARICSWARLRDRATGRPLLMANCHFDHLGELARHRSAIQLAATLPALADGAPIVLTGDFNSTEDDAPYAALIGSGLVDAYRAVHPTRDANELSFNGYAEATRGARIDWILHAPSLVATAATIDRTRGPGGLYLSDHDLVTATLRWAAPQ